MTKSEYMEALQKKLEIFNRELQQEIVEDYEQHFAEGISAGKTEEEIVAELGSIEDMIRELPEGDIKTDGETIQKNSDSKEMHTAGGMESGASEKESDTDSEERSQSRTCTGECKAVVIDGAVADVNIEPSSDGNIHVLYHNDDRAAKYRFYQYERDGVFYAGIKRNEDVNAKEAKRAVKFMLFGKSLEVNLDESWSSADNNIVLYVKIPAGLPNVEVTTLNGDIDVRNVNPAALNMNTTSGDITIRHVTVDRMKLNTTSGDISGTQIYSADLNVNTANGDIELKDTETGTGHIHSASGDIAGSRLRGNDAVVGTGSGDVEFEGSFARYNIKTGSGDVELKVEAGAEKVRVTTGSGDAEVDVTALDSVEITVGTGSGDAVICSEDNVRHQVTHGTCTVGNGDCKVHVSTGSGDVEVRRS